jgi:hypothetical protein
MNNVYGNGKPVTWYRNFWYSWRNSFKSCYFWIDVKEGVSIAAVIYMVVDLSLHIFGMIKL